MFYALIGVAGMSIIYTVTDMLKKKAELVDYELARANYYRVLAIANYVNVSNKSISINLGDCSAFGRNNTLTIVCMGIPYLGKTGNLDIEGFGKGNIIMEKKGNTIVIYSK